MQLTGIHIYPVKSCRGVAVDAAELDGLGLRGDRRWMIVDEEGIFLSQRELPRLALIEPQAGAGWLTLAGPGIAPVGLRAPAAGGRRARVRVWEDSVDALDGGEEAARWLSGFLDRPARLVYLPEDAGRRIAPAWVPEERYTHFGDGFPLLLITEASLAELNRHLAEPVPMNRFRPNLVVSGTGPFDEDGWQGFRIGQVAFRAVKPCSRCATTTVDQATGVRGREPLATLATFRRRGVEVFFGQNVVHEGPGSLAVGDAVHLL